MYPFFVRRKLLTAKNLNQCVGRDTVVGISDSLRAGSNPGWEVFPTHPDRPCGPTSLL